MYEASLVLATIVGWAGFIALSIYIYIFRKRKRYRKERRLEDVIRLIKALALESSDFKTEASIVETLRGQPESAGTWFGIAKEHSEFFRPNGPNTHYALIARSYLPVISGTPRATLSWEATQYLCDLAVKFQEKEDEQSHKYILWFPIIVALISSLTILFISYKNTQPVKDDKLIQRHK